MSRYHPAALAAILVAALAFVVVSPLGAQVGKGIADVNTASEADLSAMPHMTPAIVKGIIEKRPFANVVELKNG